MKNEFKLSIDEVAILKKILINFTEQLWLREIEDEILSPNEALMENFCIEKIPELSKFIKNSLTDES